MPSPTALVAAPSEDLYRGDPPEKSSAQNEGETDDDLPFTPGLTGTTSFGDGAESVHVAVPIKLVLADLALVVRGVL